MLNRDVAFVWPGLNCKFEISMKISEISGPFENTFFPRDTMNTVDDDDDDDDDDTQHLVLNT